VKLESNLLGIRDSKAERRYFNVMKYQLALLLLLCLLLVIVDVVIAYSALIGGMVYMVPNAWHAWRHFRVNESQTAGQALGDLYAGQIWKMALMATLFALSFVYVEPLSGFSLFASLLLMQVSYLVMQVGGNRF